MDNRKTPKNAKKFICEKCNFVCSKKSDYERHLFTAKHKRIIMDNIIDAKKEKYFECKCGKAFCGQHKHPEVHNCSYDHKNDGLQSLKQKLIKVAGTKVIPI